MQDGSSVLHGRNALLRSGRLRPRRLRLILLRSSDFFSESRMPPPVGGEIGVAGPAGCDCDAGSLGMIELGLRS